MVDQTRKDYFNRRLSALREERSSFIDHWRVLAEFIQPRRGRFLVSDRNRGDRRHQSIINSQATQAHRIATAGMLAGTMSPARPWFNYEPDDPDLLEYMPVKVWLQGVERTIYSVLSQSNFYSMAQVMLAELILFGTAPMTQVDDHQDVTRFYAHTAGSYMIAQNARYEIDTLMREFEMTVGQMIGQFGADNVSPAVRNQWDRGNYDPWYPVIHLIEPNQNADSRRAGTEFKPFLSCYYEPGMTGTNDQMLRRAGFDEFPVVVPRWDVTGEDIYGTNCPAMTALGDIKSLQIQERLKAQAIAKMVNPPLKGPPSLKNVAVSSLPGGLVTADGIGGTEGLAPIYTVNPQVGELRLDAQAVEQRIDNAFYVNLFLAISNMEGIQPRNQLDIMHRNEERLLQLGPVLEHLHASLNHVLDRAFNQCNARGMLPPAPQVLQGRVLRPRYISSLAMAQRAVATGSIERVVGFAGLLQPLRPDIGDKLDADQSLDEFAGAIGAPPRIIVPDDMVAQTRAARAEAQQQEKQLAMLNSVADSAGKAAKGMPSGFEMPKGVPGGS